MILAKRTWTLEQIRSAANEAAKSDGWCYDCHAPVRSGEGHADDCHGGAVQSMLHAFADLLEARAAKPEPSPLSEQDFETLIAWTRHEFPYDGYVDRCLHCSKQRTDGHSVSCPLLLTKRLIAQARAARPSLWQPIETAPKDGTWILAFGSEAYSTPNRIRSMAWFDEGEWGIGWYDDLGEGRFSPTHWQPLPAPPAQDGGRP